MGLLRLHSKVVITKENGDEYVFNNHLHGIEHNTSVEDLTDTAKVTFPYSGKFQGRNLFAEPDPIFQQGDSIKIYQGYYPDLYLRFNGWISGISAKIPVEVSCQDHMYQLKNSSITYPQKRITYYYGRTSKGKISKKPLKNPRTIGESITLKGLLDYCLGESGEDWTYECPDVNLGLLLFTNVSIAKVFETLKDKYGLYARFRNEKLIVGFQYDAANTNTYKYEFNKTVPWAIIDDSDLQYQLADKVSLKVVAKLMGLNNTFEEVTVGDTDGAQRTLHFYWDGTTLPKPDLKKLAEEELLNGRFDGYRGSFTTFGYYPIQAGDVASLTSKKFPEKDGDYLVTSVSETFDQNGYKQRIEIGNKI
jgi:hypothetical protein